MLLQITIINRNFGKKKSVFSFNVKSVIPKMYIFIILFSLDVFMTELCLTHFIGHGKICLSWLFAIISFKQLKSLVILNQIFIIFIKHVKARLMFLAYSNHAMLLRYLYLNASFIYLYIFKCIISPCTSTTSL